MVFSRGFAITIADAVVDGGTGVLVERTSEAVDDVVSEELEVAIFVVVGSDVDRLMFRISVEFVADSVCDDSDDVCCMLGDADGLDPEAPVID